MAEDKYYKIMTIRLKKDEDKELIEQLERKDVSKRELLRKWYYEKPEMPTDLCSIAQVEELMRVFRVHPRTRQNIVDALRKKCE